MSIDASKLPNPDFTIYLPWGKTCIPLRLPPDWSLQGVLNPCPRAPVLDLEDEVRRSLAQPIGMPMLSELGHPGSKVALVIDDDSRPTPGADILPGVLAERERGGVNPADITLIPHGGSTYPIV